MGNPFSVPTAGDGGTITIDWESIPAAEVAALVAAIARPAVCATLVLEGTLERMRIEGERVLTEVRVAERFALHDDDDDDDGE